VDIRAEVRDFLRTRRAKITPQSLGLPTEGQRRVPGLRRSEVATLAGVSIECYSELERGYLSGVSSSVLKAIARALQLDPVVGPPPQPPGRARFHEWRIVGACPRTALA
jgi:hypothetical protein